MKKAIKIILPLIGIAIIYIYCMAIPYGVFSIGTSAGIAVGLALILIAILLDKIILLWNKKLGKVVISIVCAIAIIGATMFGITLNKVVNETNNDYAENETLVILGCQVHGETPSSPLRNRVLAGAKYLNQNPNAKVVVCGGKGRGESITEAECMRRILVDNGIDESRIIVEDKSTSTYENLKFAKQLIDDNNIVISTSDYHCYRAELIAKRNGFNASTIPVGTFKKAYPSVYTREVLAVWGEYLK